MADLKEMFGAGMREVAEGMAEPRKFCHAPSGVQWLGEDEGVEPLCSLPLNHKGPHRHGNEFQWNTRAESALVSLRASHAEVVKATREWQEARKAVREYDFPVCYDFGADPVGSAVIQREKDAEAALAALDLDTLLAAAPHLERHFRAKLAGELRAEAKRCDPTHAYPRGPGRWLDAADHLVRPEVMG